MTTPGVPGEQVMSPSVADCIEAAARFLASHQRPCNAPWPPTHRCPRRTVHRVRAPDALAVRHGVQRAARGRRHQRAAAIVPAELVEHNEAMVDRTWRPPTRLR